MKSIIELSNWYIDKSVSLFRKTIIYQLTKNRITVMNVTTLYNSCTTLTAFTSISKIENQSILITDIVHDDFGTEFYTLLVFYIKDGFIHKLFITGFHLVKCIAFP